MRFICFYGTFALIEQFLIISDWHVAPQIANRKIKQAVIFFCGDKFSTMKITFLFYFQNFKDNIRELSRIAFYLQVSQKTVEFSEKLTERLLDHIQRKPITDLTLFCIQFSFIVQNNDRVPYWLISKMVDLVPQLSIRQVSFILSHNINPKWKKHMEFRQALKTRIMDIITEESAKMDILGEEL